MHRLYYHVVWTTRDRRPLLDPGLARFLCHYLRGVARQERVHILEIGMVSTHVHILIRAHPIADLTRLLQRLKGCSAAVANKERASSTGVTLRWSKGYSIHTVGQRSLEAVRQYLRAQPNQHPDERIAGWQGDEPEYEGAAEEEWLDPGRARIRARWPRG